MEKPQTPSLICGELIAGLESAISPCVGIAQVLQNAEEIEDARAAYEVAQLEYLYHHGTLNTGK